MRNNKSSLKADSDVKEGRKAAAKVILPPSAVASKVRT